MALDWQNTFENQKDRFWHLLQSKKFTDCNFDIVDSKGNKKKISAHKIILSAASPVFERMFYGSMPEKGDVITITDIQFKIFESMLKYVYTDCIDTDSVEELSQLYYVAQKYMLHQMMKKCNHRLCEKLNHTTACETYEFAEFFNDQKLKQKCLEFIISKTREVLQDASFCRIKMSTMLVILDQNSLNIASELDLFNALVRLANAKGLINKTTKENNINTSQSDPHDNDKVMLKEAIKKIRFLTLTPEEFAKGPARSKLLEKQEALDISIILNSPKCDEYPLPQGFSSSRKRRAYLVQQSSSWPFQSATFSSSPFQPTTFASTSWEWEP